MGQMNSELVESRSLISYKLLFNDTKHTPLNSYNLTFDVDSDKPTGKLSTEQLKAILTDLFQSGSQIFEALNSIQKEWLKKLELFTGKYGAESKFDGLLAVSNKVIILYSVSYSCSYWDC
jgi:hypothetical protein